MRRWTLPPFVLTATLSLCVLVATPAQAQRGYVTNAGASSVSVIDTATNAAQGAIGVGAGPSEVAITPDGTHAYVANADDDSVSVIDVAANAVVATVAVGDEPRGIAVTPDGSCVYVANTKGNSVSAIATATNSLVGPPTAVGGEPEGIAITPEGLRALVAQRGGGISVIATATGSVVSSIPDALGPAKLAISPDGSRGFAVNKSSNSVTVFSLATETIFGAPIFIGANPSGIALSPNGPAYVSSPSDGTVVAVDPAGHARVGPPISGFADPAGIASTADGSLTYVVNSAAASVSVIDAVTALVASQIPVGAAPQGIAIIPDQPPHAVFSAERVEKRGQVLRFDASHSTDSDGQIGTFAWDFGDGQSESVSGPQVEHTYENPGSYRVTLTVTDRQGCSTAFVFTGQTASCNGSGVARTSAQVEALDTIAPAFRFAAGHRQFLAPRVTLNASCPKENCAVAITGVLKTAVKTRRGRTGVRLPTAGARVSIPSGGKARIKLRLTGKAVRAARRSLANGGQADLRLRATATDAAGNKTARQFEITLVAARRNR